MNCSYLEVATPGFSNTMHDLMSSCYDPSELRVANGAICGKAIRNLNFSLGTKPYTSTTKDGVTIFFVQSYLDPFSVFSR